MKKLGYILGRRIRGDLELDLDPITQQPGIITAPGARIPGRPEQGIYVASAAQNYRLGTRRVQDSNRVFRYTKLATTTRTDGYGGYSAGLGLFSKVVPSGALTIVRAAIGERTVTISAPTLVVNAYAGGLLTMFEVGQPVCILGIISNTATVITLDGPLPGTYTPGAIADSQVIPGPYHEVVIAGVSCNAAGLFDPVVGIFNSPLDEDGNVAAAGDYVWIQTWGLCNMWASGAYEGAYGGEREVVVQGDGAAQIIGQNGTTASVYYLSFQRIGFIYPSLGPTPANVGNHPEDSGGSATTIMNHIVFLQIAP